MRCTALYVLLKRTMLTFAALGVLAPATVTAQETGTLITNRSAEIDARGRDAARRTMDAFTACLVSRYSGRAQALTRLPIDSPQYDRVARNMFDTIGDECLSGSGQLSFSDALFRAGIFQALYAREFGDNGPTDFSAVASTGYRQLYGEELSPHVRQALALEQFGECVARADAAGVRNLLAQHPGSAGETAAINALRPSLAGCIPQDNTITFSASILRGALAEGIYRLSVALREQPATPTSGAQ